MVKMKCVTGVLYNVCVFIHEDGEDDRDVDNEVEESLDLF